MTRDDYSSASSIYKDMQKVSQEMAQQIDVAMKILVKTDFSAYMKQRQTDGLGAKKK